MKGRGRGRDGSGGREGGGGREVKDGIGGGWLRNQVTKVIEDIILMLTTFFISYLKCYNKS